MTRQEISFRLSSDAYRQLENQLLSDIIVSDKTTDIQSGYMLGIQKVLKVLRDGFTVG